jgi:hypothetical protein
MRLQLPVVAFGLCCLLPLGVIWAVQPSDARSDAPSSTPAPTPGSSSSAAADKFASDAAARHAKRTACLKEAKTKKLVGAKRSAYVKNCLGAP